MVEEHIAAEDVDKTCFRDTKMDSFGVEPLVLQKNKVPTLFSQEVQCSQGDDLWTMYFDDASSKEGVGVGVVFISPSKETFRFSFTLTFACRNNIVEYEALLLGLKAASKHKIKNLHLIGDSKLVVQHIKTSYASKNKRLKQYRNAIWDEIETFDVFGITWINISNKKMTDLLANVAIMPNDDSFIGISIVEVQSRTSIPDNIEN